jgi:hypothetical protein
MIECRPKQRAALQAACELSGELLHAPNRGQLRHVQLQHLEVFQQQRALIIEGRLKRLAPTHRVFDLAEDPRIRHCAATDQDSIATGIAKSIEGLLNRHDVTTPGYGNLHDLFYLAY